MNAGSPTKASKKGADKTPVAVSSQQAIAPVAESIIAEVGAPKQNRKNKKQ